MRTTLDLPQELLTEALSVTRIKTKTALIITALTELIRRNKISDLKKYKGKINISGDLDILRNRR